MNKPDKNSDVIVTGVMHNHSCEWLHDDMDNGIGLDYEAARCDLSPKEFNDFCEWYPEQGDILIGFKKCNRNNKEAWFAYQGKYGTFAYRLDPDADYSAIVGETTTQIVASKYARLSPLCSPCYPGQGDLDSEPYEIVNNKTVDQESINLMIASIFAIKANAWAYAPPPELVGGGKMTGIVELED